jgi:amino acid transporter
MAFGCMVGWGVFAMPGTTFLPIAGPLGTMLSMLIGMVIMLVIASNLSFMMGRSAVTGGVYAYTKEAFGRDHAFLSSWFLCLSYLTIVFLNGTALFFIIRTLFSDAAQSGPHYMVSGQTIYLGETLLSVLVLAGTGILFVAAKPALQRINTALAITLFAGIALTAAFCLPQSLFGKLFGKVPARGQRMKGNFYKCSGSELHEHYGCWSHVGTAHPDFDRPEYFGDIILE